MLALARLHLLVDDLDACQQQCSQLLEMDKDNDTAFMVNYPRASNSFDINFILYLSSI